MDVEYIDDESEEYQLIGGQPNYTSKRTLSEYEKRTRIHRIVTALIRKGQLAFEQTGFWRWRLKAEELKYKEDRIVDAVELCE